MPVALLIYCIYCGLDNLKYCFFISFCRSAWHDGCCSLHNLTGFALTCSLKFRADKARRLATHLAANELSVSTSLFFTVLKLGWLVPTDLGRLMVTGLFSGTEMLFISLTLSVGKAFSPWTGKLLILIISLAMVFTCASSSASKSSIFCFLLPHCDNLKHWTECYYLSSRVFRLNVTESTYLSFLSHISAPNSRAVSRGVLPKIFCWNIFAPESHSRNATPTLSIAAAACSAVLFKTAEHFVTRLLSERFIL